MPTLRQSSIPITSVFLALARALARALALALALALAHYTLCAMHYVLLGVFTGIFIGFLYITVHAYILERPSTLFHTFSTNEPR
jgi:hypothetical protein